MTSASTTVPDIEVTRYALRTFDLDAYHRELLPISPPMRSWTAHSVWRAGTCIAHCDQGSLHAAPAEDCSCGIYGATNLRSLLLEHPHLAARVVAVIAVEGTIIIGSEGLRTAAARVVAYWCQPSPEPDLAHEIFAERCPDAVSFTDCDAMLAAYGLRMTPPDTELTGVEASPPTADLRTHLRLAASAAAASVRLVAAPILLAILLISADRKAMSTVLGGEHISPTGLAISNVVIAANDLVAAIISHALPVVFGYSAVVLFLTLVRQLVALAGGPLDWTNWPSFAQRSAHHAARSGLRLSIFLLAYAVVFAGGPVPATLITTTLIAGIVHDCTTTPFLGLVSRIAATLNTRIADIVRRLAGRSSLRRSLRGAAGSRGTHIDLGETIR